jgi:predicted HicB family RNase H-like nuclease
MAASQHQKKDSRSEYFLMRITSEDHENLRLAAKERGVSKAALVREALMSVGVPMAA